MRLKELIIIKYTELAIVRILIKILLSQLAACSGACSRHCSAIRELFKIKYLKFLYDLFSFWFL